MRPIVSSIDTYNYKLAQYLGSLLSLHIPSNYTTKDSFTFIEEIKQLNRYVKFLISFDVTSLFTNIPLEETINIPTDTIFQNYPNVKFTGKELQKLFKIATSETHFIFNNEMYDQIDCVSVGSLLAPILANLFMGYHEKDWIEKVQVAKPTFYKRYVDDIFAVFESELDAEAVHTCLNTKHRNNKFTYKKQIENKLPFLYILMSNNENLQTSVFHKKTYTGLLLNYFSFVPDSYKYGLIKTLINRMYRINSTWTSFDIDLKNLKQVLLKNQYPLTMIDNVIKKYLQNAVNKTNTGSMLLEMPNIETRLFQLPFIGMYSKVTQSKIEKLCKNFAKMPNLNWFSPAINCVKHFHTTILIQVFSVQRLLMSSADCLNVCSRDCFSILDTARTKQQLRIKESLLISWLNPTLNKQKSHQYITSLSI